MPVGDVNSEERGSGARYNDGKINLTLLPPEIWVQIADDQEDVPYSVQREVGWLADFWYGDDDALDRAFSDLTAEDLMGAAEVFAFGAKKYAPWNWAKGMSWSVPMACYLRHSLLVAPDYPDDDSLLPHRWHAVCNLVMLRFFRDYCPDMDDRPKELRAEFHDSLQDATTEQLGGEWNRNWVPLEDEEDFDDLGRQIREIELADLDLDEEAIVDDLVAALLDLPTPELNDAVERLVEEQEFRERVLRTSGQLI
jgi:hypothetical protein